LIIVWTSETFRLPFLFTSHALAVIVVVSLALKVVAPPPDTLTWFVTDPGEAATFTVTVIAG